MQSMVVDSKLHNLRYCHFCLNHKINKRKFHEIILPQRDSDIGSIVNVILRALNAWVAGAEDAVPETSLLAVVVALPVAFAVVKIVVLNNDIPAKVVQQPA